MANTILPILLENYLIRLLKDHPNLFFGLKGQVSSIQIDLRIINEKLRENNVGKHHGDDVKKVVDQVKDVCLEVEDVMDTYLTKVVIQRRQKMGIPPGRLSHLISHVKVFRDAASKTRRIAIDIGKHIKYEEAANGTGVAESTAAAAQEHQSRQSRNFVEDDFVAGFDRDMTILVNQLIDPRNSRRSVTSIIGMGGLGKTTLARKIYNKIYKEPPRKNPFLCVAWVHVSQGYNRTRFFLDLLECFNLNYHSLSDDGDLASKVREHLGGKRYFVVMDDIWKTEVWEDVKIAFPDDLNGSRILITSRHKEIASAASPGTPYLLSFLDNEASWELFCRNQRLMFLEEEDRGSDLINLGKLFVESCKGLPLSIIDLAEVLAGQGKTYESWSNFFLDGIDGYSNHRSKWCLEYMALSYNHLPQHLKPCFLYLGVFPKDSEIQTKVLTQLWIAEGFVQKIENITADAVAEDYLEKLIDGNLIQVTSRRGDGTARTCLSSKDLKVQSKDQDPASGDKPPRNTETSQQQKKNLEDTQSEDDPSSRPKPPTLTRSNPRQLKKKMEAIQSDHDPSSGDKPRRNTESNLKQNKNLKEIQSGDHGNRSSSSIIKPRRLSVHCNNLSYYVTWNTIDASSARSLLYFCGQKQIQFDKKKWMRLCQGLKFIRVLSFYNININGELDLSGIENLIFLRCFKIRGSGLIKKIPDSMCNLRFLETLDLGVQVSDCSWPKNIWRMKRLRRLCSLPMKFPEPDDQTRMGKYSTGCNLQVLSELYVEKKTSDFLGNTEFPYLLDLGLFYKGSELFDQSQMTKVLQSLEKLQHLQRIRLSGFINCDRRLYNLTSTLTKVRLYNSSLDSNFLSILGDLPKLLALTMKLKDMGCESDTIIMEEGKFQQLRALKMIGYDIQMWELEKNAMPNLQHLVLLGNQRMKALPEELWKRKDLRLVQMSEISESLRNSLRKLEGFTKERRLDSPPADGNPRYLQGMVSEFIINRSNESKARVLIGEAFEFGKI
ncbi:hypothetical protein FNV43_RR00053 [Rhamnella rubrinervis]|uniref:Uncharacterized protein n=1 Tax=Rhamnella rubrinervis TaxID=2594499 RepID=A0A8K0HPU7_9ROSA|nr:hypothetical protein FNV43_RR00053 [Rhamnella rubrinervis]